MQAGDSRARGMLIEEPTIYCCPLLCIESQSRLRHSLASSAGLALRSLTSRKRESPLRQSQSIVTSRRPLQVRRRRAASAELLIARDGIKTERHAEGVNGHIAATRAQLRGSSESSEQLQLLLVPRDSHSNPPSTIRNHRLPRDARHS